MGLLGVVEALNSQGLESVSQYRQNGVLIVRLQDDPVVAQPQDIPFEPLNSIVLWIHPFLRDHVREQALGHVAFGHQDLDGLIPVWGSLRAMEVVKPKDRDSWGLLDPPVLRASPAPSDAVWAPGPVRDVIHSVLFELLFCGLSRVSEYLSWRRFLIFNVVALLQVPKRIILRWKCFLNGLKILLPKQAVVSDIFRQGVCGAVRGHRSFNPHWGPL